MTPFSDSQPVALSSPVDSPPPSNSPRNKQAGTGCVVAFCGLFALIGLCLLVTLFLKPVAQVVAARSWTAVPCRITSSIVSSHTDSDGTNYSADIVYSYVYNGQSYNSGRYSFGNQLRGKYNGRMNLVARYPTGSLSTCYVNPSDPESAVLERGFTPDIWVGLFSLPFLLFGTIGIGYAFKQKKALDTPKADWKPKSNVQNTGQPVVLRAQSSPWGRFIGITFVAAFWNGITGFMVWKIVIQGEGGTGFSIFGALFFIPFVLVGVAIVAGWLQSLLALGNARPVLTLSQGTLRVGESGELLYQLRGGPFVPRTLQVTLEGREEATFSRGTDSVTSKSTFYFETLVQSCEARSGSCRVAIPAVTMHSLETPHNKILWVLRLHGPIRFWPDISEEWKITVEPGR